MPIISKGRQSKDEKILYYLIHIVVIIWLLLLLFPLYWMFTSSLKSDLEVFAIPPKLFPSLPRSYLIRVDYIRLLNVVDSKSWNKVLKKVLINDAALSIWGTIDEFREQAIAEIRFEGYLGNNLIFSTGAPSYLVKRLRDTKIIAVRLNPERILSHADELISDIGFKEFFVESLPYTDSSRLKDIALDESDNFQKELYNFLKNYPLKGTIVGIKSSINPFRIFDTYIAAWKYGFGEYPFGRYIINSAIITGSVIVTQLLISSLAGYSLSRLLPTGISRVLLLFFLATLMLPAMVLFLPLFLIIKEFPFSKIPLFNIPFPHFNLTNTYIGVILPYTAWGFSVYLFKGFFDQIPSDYIDAARIDGASEWNIFFSIVMPLSKSIYGALALITFLAVWNDFLWPFLVNTDRAMWTFTVALFQAQVSLTYPNQSMASSFIASIPTILMFAFFQRFIEQGVVFSGLKG